MASFAEKLSNTVRVIILASPSLIPAIGTSGGIADSIKNIIRESAVNKESVVSFFMAGILFIVLISN